MNKLENGELNLNSKNIFKLNKREIKEGKKWVNMYIDYESWYFIDMNINNLNKSEHSKLWYIHLHYNEKDNILKILPIKLKKSYIDYLPDELNKIKDFSSKEIEIIRDLLCNFEDNEILWIITNLEENSKEKIIEILTNLEPWKIAKPYKGIFFDNITLFILLKVHWVDLYKKWNKWNKSKRKYISNYIKILNDLLLKSDFWKLLEERDIIWKWALSIKITDKRINYI